MAIISKNKTVASILAALMLASMALPASAADLNIGNGSGGSTTDVVLSCFTDVDPQSEDAFTITIPAQIELQAENNGNDGMTITNKDGTSPSIDFSGSIGQDDTVVLNITSSNRYHLMNGDTEVAGYSIDFTTNEDNGIDIKTERVKTGDETKTISWNYAKAFHGEASIGMTFANDGSNTIYGKGDYRDTLTFEYQYQAHNSATIVCDNGLEIEIEDDHIISPDLSSYISDTEFVRDTDYHGDIYFYIEDDTDTRVYYIDYDYSNYPYDNLRLEGVNVHLDNFKYSKAAGRYTVVIEVENDLYYNEYETTFYI